MCKLLYAYSFKFLLSSRVLKMRFAGGPETISIVATTK